MESAICTGFHCLMRQPIIFSLVCNKQVDKNCCAWWWLITEIDCSSKEVIQEKKWQVLPCGQWFLDPWPISAISKILVIRWRSNAVQSTARLKCTKISLGWRIIGSSLPLLIVASMLQQCHQAVHHEVTRTKHLISIMDGGAVTRPRAALLLLHYDYQSGWYTYNDIINLSYHW